jgi:hypothetical protein
MKLMGYLQNWRAWSGSKVKQQDSLEKKEGAEAKNKSLRVYGKKLKWFKRRTTENPLSCWQCIILNNANS